MQLDSDWFQFCIWWSLQVSRKTLDRLRLWMVYWENCWNVCRIKIEFYKKFYSKFCKIQFCCHTNSKSLQKPETAANVLYISFVLVRWWMPARTPVSETREGWPCIPTSSLLVLLLCVLLIVDFDTIIMWNEIHELSSLLACV